MDFVEQAQRLFSHEPRPEHFTDYRHCAECEEHDATLRNASPETLSIDDVKPGWDPLCFITPQGFRYYFPALVRLAIDGSGPSYFVDQLIFHLEHDGDDNVRLRAFSVEQRAFVVALLHHLVELHAAEIEDNRDAENLFRTLAIWENALS